MYTVQLRFESQKKDTEFEVGAYSRNSAVKHASQLLRLTYGNLPESIVVGKFLRVDVR